MPHKRHMMKGRRLTHGQPRGAGFGLRPFAGDAGELGSHRKPNLSSAVVCALLLMAISVSVALARGGGGCFTGDTSVLRADGSGVAIREVRPGEALLAFTDSGVLTAARVRSVICARSSELLVLNVGGVTVCATPEHPFCVAPGEFRAAGMLRPGDDVLALDGSGLTPRRVGGVEHIARAETVYNLSVDDPFTFFAAGLGVHNKGGGCFLAGTGVLREDGSSSVIESLRPGDALRSFTSDGGLTTARVRRIERRTVVGHLILTIGGAALRVTEEHPFCVAPGRFRPAGELCAGDTVLALEDGAFVTHRVDGIEANAERATVYDLSVDAPNTFFAEGVAVHNKGGGCFAVGTPVSTTSGVVAIETLRPGDGVVAVDESGALVPACVTRLALHSVGECYRLRIGGAELRVTGEHPLCVGPGSFRRVDQLRAGDLVLTYDGRALVPSRVESVERLTGEVTVCDLSVDGPHTFVAGGVVAHNKGGGGGGFRGGGHRSSGRSSSGGGGGGDAAVPIIFFVVITGIIATVVIVGAIKGARENLDHLFTRAQIDSKARKTRRLIAFIERTDPAFNESALLDLTRATFLKLQECWQARQYSPMQPLMMPDLYVQHLAQIDGMIRNHEINRLDGLEIECIDIVHLHYTNAPHQRSFTALFTASAKDFYVDDRTNARLRGDYAKARFQEFWTFQFQDGQWRLREIEQTAESDALKDENFFEPFTDDNLRRLYAQEADEAGPAGPALTGGEELKATRIERMLNFLARTDKLWDRQAILDRARQVFVRVCMAREKGDSDAAPAGDLFPESAETLRRQIADQKALGVSVEFRNFCVRKVELILVQNFIDNRRDEFTVRITAHAQRVVRRDGGVLSEQPDVTAFEEYWTFGRLDNQWKLRDIELPSRGRSKLARENKDEDSTPEQMAWYYKHSRAT